MGVILKFDDPFEPVPTAELLRGLMDSKDQIAGYANSIVRDMQVAEDIFQEVCLGACSDTVCFDSVAGAVRWAMRVARNKSIDHMRKNRTQVQCFSPELLDQLATEWSLRNGHVPGKQRSLIHERLEECLGQLTARSKELIELRYGADLKPATIASQLGRKVETVYRAISRSLLNLRVCMEGLESDGNGTKS